MRLYLDVCCLCRKFDDASQLMVAAEADAVRQIMEAGFTLLAGEMVRDELLEMPGEERRAEVLETVGRFAVQTEITGEIERRAVLLTGLGFGVQDAVHIASAEAAGADWLLSTDQRLVSRGQRLAHLLKVKIDNPRDWWLRWPST